MVDISTYRVEKGKKELKQYMYGERKGKLKQQNSLS